MKKLYALLLSGLLISLGTTLAQNQEKCASHSEYLKAKLNDPSIQLKESQFEAMQMQKGKKGNIPTKTGIITIPVVFHIIHNGEPLGTGDNVSDATVMYQLQRINEDFRKLNADTLPFGHPFYADQADCEIEFCLASIDTNGNPTSGIIRYNMASTGYTINQIDNLIKPQTIWNRYNYINFWCVNIVDPSVPGVDGYATFPTATTDQTDGVVVSTSSFGYLNGTDKSITATHELGHFFNLLHIWGDDLCGDDMVSDTPTAEHPNSGCPTFPYNVSGPCGPGVNGEMYMNYMDYSDAVCVVMFSNGQKARMLSAISTFRSSLMTSNGCQPAVLACNSTISMSVTNNTGNAITTTWTPVPGAGWYEFRYKESSTSTWSFGGTANGTTTTKTFSGLTPNTSYDFEAITHCPNGSAGSWSTTLVLSTNALSGCALPPAVSATTVTGNSATITWPAVSGAGYYAFRYKLASTSTWISGGTAGSFATSKTYTGLVSNSLYDFEGRTICANNVASAWGPTSFTTTSSIGCELPPVLNATATTTTSSIAISWSAVAGAGWYSFQYKPAASSTWINGGTAGPSATSKTYTGLVSGTTYEFQIRTHCPSGVASSWSANGVYSTNPDIASIQPTNTQTNISSFASDDMIKIYPNPTSDKLNIEIFTKRSGNTTIQLMDMSGRLVRELNIVAESGVNTITLDIQEVNVGLYSLLVYQNEELISTNKLRKI